MSTVCYVKSNYKCKIIHLNFDIFFQITAVNVVKPSLSHFQFLIDRPLPVTISEKERNSGKLTNTVLHAYISDTLHSYVFFLNISNRTEPTQEIISKDVENNNNKQINSYASTVATETCTFFLSSVTS